MTNQEQIYVLGKLIRGSLYDGLFISQQIAYGKSLNKI